MRDPEKALDAARQAYERNDSFGSIRQLDRARRFAAARADEHLLRRILAFSEGVDARDERTRIARDNLGYTIKQNLRQATRKQAYATNGTWLDPYPELETPRAHTRVHFSLPVKLWIAVGVVAAVLVAGALVSALFAGSGTTTAGTFPIRVRNDTGSDVLLKWCYTATCDDAADPIAKETVESGVAVELKPPRADLVDLLVFYRQGQRIGCLPIRVHDAYVKLGGSPGGAGVSVSQMTPCPGTTVLPRIAQDASAA